MTQKWAKEETFLHRRDTNGQEAHDITNDHQESQNHSETPLHIQWEGCY